MSRIRIIDYGKIRVCVLFFLIGFISNAQITHVEILGGATVAASTTVSISAGNTKTFRVTNVATSGCKSLKVKDINLTSPTPGTSSFSISPFNPKDNIKPEACNGDHDLLFTITRTDNECSTASITVTLDTNDGDFTFYFEVSRSPEINLAGGSPLADINNNDTGTSTANGTYYGIVEGGDSITRYFVISNTGSCPLDISNITTSPTDPLPRYDFTVPSYVLLPNNSPSTFPTSINAGSYVLLPVTFLAPVGGSGTLRSTISITNSANTTFEFDVTAEMFNYNIPGPGGVVADFRTWLQATRGITRDGSAKVSEWKDVGTNPKSAEQLTPENQPTYKDNVASNINFNPVIKFENDGTTSLNQFLSNSVGGYYNQDIYIVMESDVNVATSSGMTIFSGTTDAIAGHPYLNTYLNDTNSVSGVGLGDFTSRISGEKLWFNQGNAVADPYYTLTASSSRSYDKAGIINVRNTSETDPSLGMSILYNSFDDVIAATKSSGFTSENLGYLDTAPDPDEFVGTPFNIGKNAHATFGNLNGRIAEIFTFAERVNDTDRQKIESYLAIKYGITLGPSNIATKNYVNSFASNNIVWDVSANNGFNYDVAGIGRDDNSDLNQKQSKSVNTPNEVTIGIEGLFTTNSKNPNQLSHDGDFFVWGNNNGAYTGTETNLITIGSNPSDITTTVTRIDRKWKMVESAQVAGDDDENIYIGIPENALTGFTKTADEEYVLIVADDPAFANANIIDVIPLKINKDALGVDVLDKELSRVYKTWYNFDGTKYFTFGKSPKLMENHAISIGTGDYLVGESNLNLNGDNFSIAAWIKIDPADAVTRTIMAKGEKLQMRLNSANKIEIIIDDTTPKYTSNMTIADSKWHHIAFVYQSGSVILYVDGMLDQSVKNIVHPSPNFNNFCVGAVYINASTVINPLLGDIDEVTVWDVALSEDQVHYIMNQELEKNAGGFVSGKIIPFSTASNEIPAEPWSGLRVYYDFNSFYGSTVEGLTNDRYFLRLRYLDKNKDLILVRSQSIPAPYISVADGTWDAESTWLNGSEIMLPNTLGLDGSLMDGNTVEIGHNITSGARDISLFSLIQTGGTLTMEGTIDIDTGTGTGQGLTISHYLELDGVIKLEGESQLVQTEISVLDADSGGYIERAQQGTANGFNYNYWSSSVGPIGGDTATRGTGASSTNPNAKIGEVLFDGTALNSYQNLTFDPSAYAADTPSTPKKISTYWLYKFYGLGGDYYSWESIDQNSPLLPGEGWTMKGTSGSALIESNQNYVFKGLPYNGDFTLPLDKLPGDVDVNRLIGNPYPSAMDASEFILDNLSIADGGYNTTTVINGALYYWNHFGQADSHNLGDYVGGYATYNLVGGTVAITQDWSVYAKGAAGPPPPALKVPGPFIPVNQGFFVSTSIEGFENGNAVVLGSVAGGDIVFKNSQRVFVPEAPINSVFMKNHKSKATAKTTNLNGTPIIRLVYDSPEGYHRQLAIGADKDASNGFDIGYDAFMADVNKEDMYWTLEGAKFVIQGVNNFNENQEFPLGVIVNKGGVIKIKIDYLENVDANKSLYIKDNLTEETYQINEVPFEIYLDRGSYNDRFKLVFQPAQKSLGVDNLELKNEFITYYDNNNSNLTIILKSDALVNKGSILNILGQEIQTIGKFSNRMTIPLKVSNGAYIIQLETDQGLVNKKIIIQ